VTSASLRSMGPLPVCRSETRAHARAFKEKRGLSASAALARREARH
jgi:hypothetical protein